MNTEINRICPFCAEAIKAAAKLCPRCRRWLTMRSFRHPMVAMSITGVPVLVAFILMVNNVMARFERIWDPKPLYSSMPGSLQIVESRMNWAQTRDGLRIFVTGIITNRSQVTWRGVEFECRFFDANGSMVDASSANGYLTIQPKDTSAFRATVVPGRSTNDYASYRISVSSARNPRAWF
jgi:hypothetical protein